MAADKLSEEDIQYIVDNIGAEWILLGTRLGLTHTEMTDLEHKPSGLIGTVKRMIKMWEKNQGGGATRQHMIKALEDLRRNDMAHHLQKTSSRTQPKDEGDSSSSQKATLFSPPHTTVQENKQGSGVIELERYEWRKKRGYCVIITNFVQLSANSPTPSLLGVEKDEEALKTTFKDFGFEVDTHRNLTADVMRNLLKDDLMNKDYSDYDCFVLCVNSHGNQGIVYGLDFGVVYVEHEIVRNFTGDKCPTLNGKPKLYFVLACQGESQMPATTKGDRPSTLPIISDHLLCMETVQGFKANCGKKGSPFVVSLCNALNSKGLQWDILQICTWVNNAVAEEEFVDSGNVVKQMPMFASTLRKQLKFER